MDMKAAEERAKQKETIANFQLMQCVDCAALC